MTSHEGCCGTFGSATLRRPARLAWQTCHPEQSCWYSRRLVDNLTISDASASSRPARRLGFHRRRG